MAGLGRGWELTPGTDRWLALVRAACGTTRRGVQVHLWVDITRQTP
jgi:hypothetical protein